MRQSQARVATRSASRYLQQLCKHWAHRFETSFDAQQGSVALPIGQVGFVADAEALTIDLVAADEEALVGLREVVVRHLERFAFRETLSFDWADRPSLATE